jgi:hypothetical protein
MTGRQKGNGGPEKERAPVSIARGMGGGTATNAARQARPAQRAVWRTKKGRQGGKGRGVALLWRQAPLLLWHSRRSCNQG